MQIEPTKRFSDRVENYVKYRPGYPAKVITFLQDQCNLSKNAVVADVGSGMGIFTALLLNNGYQVFAVEPNEAMQAAAVHQLSENKNFVAVNGNADNTTLSDKSVDLITCAQAFHWFDREKTRAEFKRILKKDGYAALIWNNRREDADDFSKAYENLLKQHTKEYTEVNHRNVSLNDLQIFFRNGEYTTVYYPNIQIFDEDGLMGRAFSSSYVPAEGSTDGEAFKSLLKGIFDQFNNNGKISFHYQTEVYVGKI